MIETIIHPHALRHGLAEEDVLAAWSSPVRSSHREIPYEDQIVAIGVDGKGRFVQMIGVMKPFGVLVYHALTPPTVNVLAELGLVRR